MKNKRQTLIVIFTMLLLAATATPALAAPLELDTGPGDGGGGAGLTGIIDGVIDLIVTIAKPLALLGIVGWGVAQFMQPFAPEINSRFQGYATKLIFGAVLVLGAGEIVDFLWSI